MINNPTLLSSVKILAASLTSGSLGREMEERGQAGDEGSGRPTDNGRNRAGGNARRCIIITDSNGRGATQDSIKNHIPREERDDLHIEVAVSYTTVATYNLVDRGGLDVRGATIVLDNLTNDVRGTQARPALTPDQLVCSVDKLWKRLRTAGAAAVVVCQVKPMMMKDVTPYNSLLSDYLRPLKGGFGCRTQIRLSFLKSDGFHVKPMYDSTIDKTYACAILGIPVPCPTPIDQFLPDQLRRRWESEWPRVSGESGRNTNHGWKW